MIRRLIVVCALIAGMTGSGAMAKSRIAIVDLSPGAGANGPVSMVITYDATLTKGSELVSQIRSYGGVAKAFTQFPIVAARGDSNVISAIALIPGVKSIEPDFPIQMFLNSGPHAIGADAVRASSPAGFGIDGSGVTVGIIDSGADATHPDIAGRLQRNVKVAFTWITCGGDPNASIPCEDDPFPEPLDMSGKNGDTTSGHGSHVSGIVAGEGIASGGTYKGVAPGAKLDMVGVGDYASITWALDGFEYLLRHAAEDNIVVISNSWGPVRAGSTSDSTPPSATNSIRVASDAAISKGIAVVFAAGNDGCTGNNSLINPNALMPGVIGVAATSRDGRAVAPFSSCGRAANTAHDPTIAAPGDTIVSVNGGPALYTDPLRQYQGMSYAVASGTSMAAPHVAGAIALIQSARIQNSLPKLSPAQLKSLLVGTATNLGQPSRYQGAGLVNVAAAVRQAAFPSSSTPSLPQSCPLISDDDGDAAQAIANTPGPSVNSLDVLSGTMTTSGGNLIATIKVNDLDPEEITSVAGIYFDFNFSLTGASPVDQKDYYLYAELLKTGASRGGLGEYTPTRVNRSGATGSATFNLATDTITITVPLSGGTDPNTYNLSGKTLSSITIVSRRQVGVIIPDADYGYSTGSWTVGGPAC